MENTGGLTKSIIIDNGDYLTLTNSKLRASTSSMVNSQIIFSRSDKDNSISNTNLNKNTNPGFHNTNTGSVNIIYTKRSINTKCMQGTFFDR